MFHAKSQPMDAENYDKESNVYNHSDLNEIHHLYQHIPIGYIKLIINILERMMR